MKLEIDLSDQSQLIKLRNELQRYLGIVEFALSGSVNAKPSGTLPLPMSFPNGENGGARTTDATVRKIIDLLPKRFNSTDIYVRYGDDAKEKRGAIKASIRRAIDEDIIRVQQRGQGRRPTQFEKVSA